LTSRDVLSAILEHGQRTPDHPAAKDLETELSFQQLSEAAAAVAAGLVARGVGEGDRVALFLPNSVEFVVAALACLWTGSIFVPLAVTDPTARLEVILADCDPSVIVTSEGAPGEESPLPESPVDRATVSELRSLGGGHQPARVAAHAAYAIYTSGTTGAPKGVLIGNPAFAAAVEATVEALGYNATTRALCVSPFHFDGSFGTLFPALYAGGAIVIRPREALLFPRTFFNAVKNESITATGFSPSYLRLLLASPQIGKLGESTLEVVALGGEAPSPGDIQLLWEAAPQVRVFNRYGPTETTIAVTHMLVTPESIADGSVPMGTPHRGVSFCLVDGDGGVIDSADRVGELYIGGSQLMDGYWRAPELTAEVMRTDVLLTGTVYRTGDLAYRTGKAEYVYVDRADRVIKRQGVRISLVELGEAMRSVAGVSAAACVLFDNEGQLGIAAFVVTSGYLSELELRRAASELLPQSMLPDRIELVDDLPMTSSSKVDELRLLSTAGMLPLRSGHDPARS
jgi:D-alanine--poly(phosphoribitol) ligase subunit 1